MRDSHGRTIDYLRISVTDRCNLRCGYCMPEGIPWLPMEEILTYEEIVEVCRAGAGLGIRHLKVTGGEPLVRKGCPALIAKLKKIPDIETVTLTTNGILLEEYLDELAAAGVDGINISLDTLDPGRYEALTGFAGLERVLRGLKAAVAAGLRVKVNAVSLDPDPGSCGGRDGRRQSAACWQAVAELAREYPVDVRFIEMMPIGFGKGFRSLDHRQLLKQLQDRYPGMVRDRSRHGFGPAVYYHVPGFRGSLGLISAVHGKFCDSCNRVRLTSTGYLKACLCYEDGIDLRGILREGKDPGQQLRREMEQVIWNKPGAHCFDVPEQMTEHGGMSRIGG